MRVIASLAAAASVAATALLVPASPATAVPAGGVVLTAVPVSAGPAALPITCVVTTGGRDSIDPTTVTFYADVNCTGPITMSGDAWLRGPVFLEFTAGSTPFSCSSCTTATTVGTYPTGTGFPTGNDLLWRTSFDGRLTAPPGYVWEVSPAAAGSCTSGTQVSDCYVTSAPWIHEGSL